MSRINRRQEIKNKEAFQAKFQLGLANQSVRVLSWLPQPQNNSTPPKNADKAEFLDLPILPGGSSLEGLEQEGSNGAFALIGSFISASETAAPTPLPSRVSGHGSRSESKAMVSLMNRMRSDTRRQIHEREREKIRVKKPEVARKPESDSDGEDSKLAHMRSKSMRPPVGKKGKGRPF